MVEYTVRVFNEDDGKIIGAEVTFFSDNGDKIGSIDIADAETLEEMQEQLAVIDETYFTEERLEELLANTNEDTVINATKLSGFLSSDFAKVSDLTNYAAASHNHTKGQITDLYNYQISANKYTVDIDDSVTITVKVTNQAGNPVPGVTVPVLKNNSSWQSGTTGVNGTFSLSYTCDTWGITTFSANTALMQIHVTGWKTIQLSTGLADVTATLYVNEELRLCQLYFQRNNITCPAGFTTLHANLIPEKYTCPGKASTNNYNTNVNDVYIHGRDLVVATDNTATFNLSWNLFMWHY